MPIPEKNTAVLPGMPMIGGSTKVAPNIARTCWIPMPVVRGQDIRSSGRTTSPGGGVFPS